MAGADYIETKGVEHLRDVTTGWSAMQGAVKSNVPGNVAILTTERPKQVRHRDTMCRRHVQPESGHKRGHRQ